MKRLSIAAWVVGLVLAMAVPAFAKGVHQVILTGGGQEVVFAGSGEPNTNTVLSDLAGSTKLFDGLWANGDRIPRPTGDLGPQITAVWLFIGPAGDIPIVQYLYPFAAGGPVGQIPGGQVFLDDTVDEAWLTLADDFAVNLTAAGFDLAMLEPTAEAVAAVATPPAPGVTATREATPEAKAETAPSETDSGWPALWPLALLAALAGSTLVVRSGIIGRRIRRVA